MSRTREPYYVAVARFRYALGEFLDEVAMTLRDMSTRMTAEAAEVIDDYEMVEVPARTIEAALLEGRTVPMVDLETGQVDDVEIVVCVCSPGQDEPEPDCPRHGYGPTRACPGCGGPNDHYPDCLPASEGGTMPDVIRGDR